MIPMDSLCLRVTQMPRSSDLAIFALTTDDRQTKPIALPLAVHARAGTVMIAGCLWTGDTHDLLGHTSC